MTTREEFALAFAIAAYSGIMKHLLDSRLAGDPCPSLKDLETMDQQTISGAVEMADKLIAELEPNK